MKYWNFALAVIVLVISNSANSALVSRLGGLAYYDDVSGLTWLTDANAAKTSGYDADGLMNWTDANNWAAGLNVAGVTGWRLADTVQPDTTCDSQGSGSSNGYNCTGSEMGNLFYNALGNTAGSLTNTGPFSNVQKSYYWTATQFAYRNTDAWEFHMGVGSQHNLYIGNNFNAWAVLSGDVSAVPVPAAVWLFGSGLISLIGVARRKKA